MIKIKRKVSIDGCRKEILFASIACDSIFAFYDVDLWVTSGTEPFKHSAYRSAHYRGDAQDWRIKHISVLLRAQVISKIKRKLGKDYVVIHEGKGKAWEHVHIHWSPTFSEVSV